MADITVDQAVDAIKTAAKEIEPEKFIDYSTILDVHLGYAHEAFSLSDQIKLLEAVEFVLSEYPTLGTNIAWDLVYILLPFLDEPEKEDPLADNRIEKAKELLKKCVEIGNPKEVFMKILEALSQLSFTVDELQDIQEEGADDEEVSEEEEETITRRPIIDPAFARAQRNGVVRFHQLLTLLSTTHTRLQTNFPSRFLSHSLTALLSAFTRAIQDLSTSSTTTLLSSILAFVEFLPATRALSIPPRPPLPPRSATGSFLKAVSAPSTPTIPEPQSPSAEQPAQPHQLEKQTVENETRRAESRLEVKLLQAFVLTLFEVFALRCKHENPKKIGAETAGVTRGVDWAYSARYEDQRNPTKTVQNGILKVDGKEGGAFSRYDKAAEEVFELAQKLGIQTDELLTAIITDEEASDDEEEEEITHPRTSLDVPFPKVGALLLLTRRLFKNSEKFPPRIDLFPEHAKIVQQFFGGALGQEDFGRDIAVVDSVLFLGLYAADKSKSLGPEVKDDEVTQYTQVLSMLSATFPSPSIRYVAKQLLQSVLQLHPEEFFILSFIQSTVEDCPLENLKTVAISILKDFIVAALKDKESKSIFGKPDLLKIIRPFIFPDMRSVNKESLVRNDEGQVETLRQRLNLLYFLTNDEVARTRLNVEGAFLKAMEETFVAPIKGIVDEEEVGGGSGLELEMLRFMVEGLKLE